MKIKKVQDLLVWNKAHTFVLAIYKITKYFPSEENYCLKLQIRRSAVSICANISEGFCKSRRDYIRYLEIARGSLEESRYHLLLSRDLGYCSNNDYDFLYDLVEQIGKMLYSLIQKLRY